MWVTYLLGEKGNLPEGENKPRTAGLLKSMDPTTVTLTDAEQILTISVLEAQALLDTPKRPGRTRRKKG